MYIFNGMYINIYIAAALKGQTDQDTLYYI